MSRVERTQQHMRCDGCGRLDLMWPGETLAQVRDRLRREGWHSHEMPSWYRDRTYDHCPKCTCPGPSTRRAFEEAV